MGEGEERPQRREVQIDPDDVQGAYTQAKPLSVQEKSHPVKETIYLQFYILMLCAIKHTSMHSSLLHCCSSLHSRA